MYTYMTIARKLDGTLLAHVPTGSFFQAERLAVALHLACECVVEVRFYYDGRLEYTEEL